MVSRWVWGTVQLTKQSNRHPDRPDCHPGTLFELVVVSLVDIVDLLLEGSSDQAWERIRCSVWTGFSRTFCTVSNSVAPTSYSRRSESLHFRYFKSSPLAQPDVSAFTCFSNFQPGSSSAIKCWAASTGHHCYIYLTNTLGSLFFRYPLVTFTKHFCLVFHCCCQRPVLAFLIAFQQAQANLLGYDSVTVLRILVTDGSL